VHRVIGLGRPPLPAGGIADGSKCHSLDAAPGIGWSLHVWEELVRPRRSKFANKSRILLCLIRLGRFMGGTESSFALTGRAPISAVRETGAPSSRPYSWLPISEHGTTPTPKQFNPGLDAVPCAERKREFFTVSQCAASSIVDLAVPSEDIDEHPSIHSVFSDMYQVINRYSAYLSLT
jgi:hypothetical protein